MLLTSFEVLHVHVACLASAQKCQKVHKDALVKIFDKLHFLLESLHTLYAQNFMNFWEYIERLLGFPLGMYGLKLTKKRYCEVFNLLQIENQ